MGALAAPLGTVLVVRDSKRGRESASEERAAAALLAQLRRVRLDDAFLTEQRASTEFLEECATAVLAFRDREVRTRLRDSVRIIINAPGVARTTNAEFHTYRAYEVAFEDIWQCLEARLDRKKPPKPSREWTAARKDLYAYLGVAADEFDATEAAHEEEQEELNSRYSNLF
ncbi:hypothetical protein [Streptomyces sp. 4N124]|uniref:hypothetical protein n=1 Tax=Streptomyces sp. 4N124 TaxID=3457420 RepID=UPI003FD0BFA1